MARSKNRRTSSVRWLTHVSCWIVLVVEMTMVDVGHAESEPADEPRFAIAMHGGAGAWLEMTAQQAADMEKTLKTSLEAGRELLSSGGRSLDAVERVIQILEDSPLFNAGKGAVFNAVGGHQLDASIMDGKDRSGGAVAAISVVKNPISVARLVMNRTPHVLLAGKGADEFARSADVVLVPPEYFWTEKTRRQWEAWRKEHPAGHDEDHHGTVGCVALDLQGNLAAGTSTGGLAGKKFGRVGDSPVIGAGTYADNDTCAVSCTGVGELFIRHAIAYDISARVRYSGQELSNAVDYQIKERLPPGTGGIIALNRKGEIVLRYNTAAMPRAVADSRGRFDVWIRRNNTDGL